MFSGEFTPKNFGMSGLVFSSSTLAVPT